MATFSKIQLEAPKTALARHAGLQGIENLTTVLSDR